MPIQEEKEIGQRARLTVLFMDESEDPPRHYPVYIADVDDLFVWMEVEPDATTVWSVGVPWSKIIGLMEEPIADLKKERAKLGAAELQRGVDSVEVK